MTQGLNKGEQEWLEQEVASKWMEMNERLHAKNNIEETAKAFQIRMGGV